MFRTEIIGVIRCTRSVPPNDSNQDMPFDVQDLRLIKISAFHMSVAEKICCFEHLTLKAFANSSPGLGFNNPGFGCDFTIVATLKELRRVGDNRATTQLFQSCVFRGNTSAYPGLQQPWAEIRERFQR